jgi:hypothetical protein
MGKGSCFFNLLIYLLRLALQQTHKPGKPFPSLHLWRWGGEGMKKELVVFNSHFHQFSISNLKREQLLF